LARDPRLWIVIGVAKTDDWALYAPHRARFTDALASATETTGGRLCLLGAGHCNDVDLERLAEVFSEIHLVDIDTAALREAASRQNVAVRSRLHLHAPVDLAGHGKKLAKWRRTPPTMRQIEASAAAALESVLARLPGPFDVVASACVLTQMSFALTDELGEGHPALGPSRLALVAAHLGTMVGLTAAGGASLFACDLVSSSFYPLADLPPERSLFEVMDRILESGNFYHVANPGLIRSILSGDPILAERVGEPELLDPWLWNGPLGRTYFVYALRFLRTSVG